ncbi:MAG: enoyl-CoA hydratase-related protein [Desulfobacterales bacterium]
MAFTGNDVVLYEKRDRKAYITLNRPEVMNALSRKVSAGMAEALADLRDDDDILVAILTGAGGRAFSAGMDLKERTQLDKTGTENTRGAVSAWDGRWTELGVWKPIIAAIDGYCLAGGMEVSLQCDIRIATKQSTFGLPEPRRSLLAGYGLHNLSRMTSLGNALYIQLTGNHIPAETAERWGIVQEVVADRDALMVRVEELADNIMECAPLAVQAIKRIVMQGRNMPVEYSIKMTESINAIINKTEDRIEGPKAFAEKRKAVWKMR